MEFKDNNFGTEKQRMLEESIKRLGAEIAIETNEEKLVELNQALEELKNK